ncbi:proline racemase family protein [Brevibacterium casei]|uniref:Proline racemase n=1 Tax=Brevibacterium casei TaxID=33889 RepID=A0A449D7H5_9MICO|nr:proline racemase family protein [Brevibacterium casei]MDH5149048.1 proline racemase family protein [Brevibacterium casei]VEW13589.1 Proline racemase [Brevibacterium casei]
MRADPARQVIHAVDVHAAGEPGRVLFASGLGIRGSTMAERLRYCENHLDGLRSLVLHEPRGYPGLCSPLIVPPADPSCDFGMIVMEQGGFRPMSGSNLICAVTVLIETGAVDVSEPLTTLRADTAAGVVTVRAEVSGGRATSVTFDNVPAFVHALDAPLDVPEYGRIPVDIVFGGQFYVQAQATHIGVELRPGNAKAIIRAASALRQAAAESFDVSHPLHPEIDEIGLPMIHGPAVTPGTDGRNAVVLPNGAVDLGDPRTWTGTLDRSPCGTGTSGRIAAKHARSELAVGDRFVHESMLGTTFLAEVKEETTVAGIPGIIPSITGRGWITGIHDLIVEADDPFPCGYTVGDLWGQDADGAVG